MNIEYLETFFRVLPVLFLILLGFLMQKIHFFKSESVGDIKNLVVNITLPSLLYLAFSELELKPNMIILPVVVFIVCVIMVLAGKVVAKLLYINTPYFPLLFGGFEAGMVGYSIFLPVYGMDQIDKFAIIDLGQVIFVFFVLLALLIRIRDGKQSKAKAINMFVTSPAIISIFLGIVSSLFKTCIDFTDTALYGSISQLLNMIGNLTVPLICIVIGYEMKFNLKALRLPIQTILIRTTFLIGLALTVNKFVFESFMGLESIYKHALITMFILPPPFVVPLFLKENDDDNRQYVLNTLSINTIFSLIVFIVVNTVYIT